MDNNPTPTLEQVQLDLLEVKEQLAQLSNLQKIELIEIRKNRTVYSKRVATVLNRMFGLLLLSALGGAAIYLYKETDTSTKNKLAETYINQLIPVVIGFAGVHQLIANKQEQSKLKSEEEADSEEADVLLKYLFSKDDGTNI